METLNITSTRKSPMTLQDIGLKNGDLLTIDTLAREIGSAYSMIPSSWIKRYAGKNGPEIKEILDNMIDEWNKEKS